MNGRCLLLILALTLGCESAPPRAAPIVGQRALSDAEFASLVERLSEPGGYFDTDNLISNESGYLKVMGALAELGTGGAYVGVGPDQNFSYLAQLRPEVAFVIDVRRDNVLHHLLLKALIERSPTRVEFLSALHGVPPPADAGGWRQSDVASTVARVDSAWAGVRAGRKTGAWRFEALQDSVLAEIDAFGVVLSVEDRETIRRFHASFAREGPGLRFTSFGRAPRPYYPTYRQLVLETDLGGRNVSYLSSARRYDAVRDMQLANRIVPVVGDLAGERALRAIGEVLDASGLALAAIYVSNVEFYLWRSGTFDRWIENLERLPASPDAVVIRSHFPGSGGVHPSSVPGYYATQTLQPVRSLVRGDFASYWEVVTRDALPLR